MYRPRKHQFSSAPAPLPNPPPLNAISAQSQTQTVLGNVKDPGDGLGMRLVPSCSGPALGYTRCTDRCWWLQRQERSPPVLSQRRQERAPLGLSRSGAQCFGRLQTLTSPSLPPWLALPLPLSYAQVSRGLSVQHFKDLQSGQEKGEFFTGELPSITVSQHVSG